MSVDIRKLILARQQYRDPKPKVLRHGEQDWDMFREYRLISDKRNNPRAKAIQAIVVKQFEDLVYGQIARFMTRRQYIPGMAAADRDDMVQIARMGLLYALDRYDPSRGNRFATPARHWIHFYLDRAADKLPAVNQRREQRMRHSMTREVDKVYALHGRAATPEELGTTQRKLDRWRLAPTVHSYHTGHTNGDPGDEFLDHLTFSETFIDPPADQEQRLVDEDMKARVASAMSLLTPMQLEVVLVKQRRKSSLASLRKRTGLSSEEIETIYTEALAVLREDLE